MSDFLSILEEHLELLSERGYQEMGLGTTEEPGVFMKELQQRFSDCIKQSDQGKPTSGFVINAVGFFEEQHPLKLEFDFDFDGMSKAIKLKGLIAKMHGIARPIKLKTIYDLPYTSHLVSGFLKEEKRRNKPENTQYLTDTEKILSFETTLLRQLILLRASDYMDKNYFPQGENYLLKQLRSKLVLQYRNEDAKEKRDFHIEAVGYFNSQKDEVRFALFYSFDNKEREPLNLHTLVAELKGKRLLYPLEKERDLPDALDVWKGLTNQLTENKSVVIYPKEKIKTLLRGEERFLGIFGYYDTLFSNSSYFIERELQAKLQKHLHESEVHKIPIERTLYLNQTDSVKCRFEYLFDPIRINLSLEKITARVDDLEKEYFPKDWSAVITVRDIHKELRKNTRLSNTEELKKARGKLEFEESRRNRRQRL